MSEPGPETVQSGSGRGRPGAERSRSDQDALPKRRVFGISVTAARHAALLLFATISVLLCRARLEALSGELRSPDRVALFGRSMKPLVAA
jgi:hypothetical protein